MSFATDTVHATSNAIRVDLNNECSRNSDICKSIPLKHNDAYSQNVALKVINLYKQSLYCIVPPGDSHTSKRFYVGFFFS